MRKVIALKVIQDGCKGIESTANAQTKEKLSQLVAVLNRLRKEMMQVSYSCHFVQRICQTQTLLVIIYNHIHRVHHRLN